MDIYLVGGAVRDTLLGRPVTDRDWVVVGATPQQMLDKGFTQVGRDFPVFLHPQTKEEYALARTERKHGHGYTGFEVHCAPDVTLEADLQRRDLTINAMAQDANGNIIDPYNGQQDLQQKTLRHVSDAFIEDPLRVLRTARFAARLADLGFSIAPQTMALMSQIVASGEMAHLGAERVWVECQRALLEDSPAVFLQCLRQCDALRALLPELDALFGVPQVAKHHPEIDTGVHVFMALQQAVRLKAGADVRFAVMLHDLGKGTTPADTLPQHIAHEERGVALVQTVCERLRAPTDYRELAVLACRYHTHCHRAQELRGKTLLKLLNACDALRRPHRFEAFLLACEADARGRLGLEDRAYPQADYLRGALAVANAVDSQSFIAQGLSGKAIGEAMAAQRIAQLEHYRSSHATREPERAR
ncbi:MAG: multifunctional CCA addition/repair protein [Gammaproteobacteria bacterium]|nr:multifunctional CCA addition/repair protein [Gammaproteobacteria bacterium]